MAWARGIKTGSATVKSVLLAVANYADEEGICWPSQDQLAEDTELSRHSIMRAMDQLEDMGLVTRERRHRGDGSRTSDLIVLDLSRTEQRSTPQRSTQQQPKSQGATAEPIIEPLLDKNKRGSRMRDDWEPDGPSIAKAEELGFTATDTRTEIERFKNYWIAIPGAKGVKLDWQRTFQNWLINASKYASRRNVVGFEPRKQDQLKSKREREEREIFLKHLVR